MVRVRVDRPVWEGLKVVAGEQGQHGEHRPPRLRGAIGKATPRAAGSGKTCPKTCPWLTGTDPKSPPGSQVSRPKPLDNSLTLLFLRFILRSYKQGVLGSTPSRVTIPSSAFTPSQGFLRERLQQTKRVHCNSDLTTESQDRTRLPRGLGRWASDQNAARVVGTTSGR